MALDLEEQEQVDELKALWKKYGFITTRVILIIFLIFIIIEIFNWFENKRISKASEAYQNIVTLNSVNYLDSKKIYDDFLSKFPRSPYAPRIAILSAKMNYYLGDKISAKKRLLWSVIATNESSVRAIALIQLGQILLEDKEYDEALKKANDVDNEGYLGLSNDLKGDVLSAMGKKEEAKKAYLEALKRFRPKDPYARFTQEKLETLGV